MQQQQSVEKLRLTQSELISEISRDLYTMRLAALGNTMPTQKQQLKSDSRPSIFEMRERAAEQLKQQQLLDLSQTEHRITTRNRQWPPPIDASAIAQYRSEMDAPKLRGLYRYMQTKPSQGYFGVPADAMNGFDASKWGTRHVPKNTV